PGSSRLAIAELQSPHPVECTLRVLTQLAGGRIRRQQQRSEDRLHTRGLRSVLILGRWKQVRRLFLVQPRTQAIQQRRLVRGVPGFAERLAQGRPGEQIRHARMTGDTRNSALVGCWPRQPLLLARIEVVSRELLVPISRGSGSSNYEQQR